VEHLGNAFLRITVTNGVGGDLLGHSTTQCGSLRHGAICLPLAAARTPLASVLLRINVAPFRRTTGIIKEGILRKRPISGQKSLRRSWRSRLFRLTETSLAYYKKSKLKGSLGYDQIVTFYPWHDDDASCGFHLSHHGRLPNGSIDLARVVVLTCEAPSAADLASWTVAIEKFWRAPLATATTAPTKDGHSVAHTGSAVASAMAAGRPQGTRAASRPQAMADETNAPATSPTAGPQ
jgi:hypothetical protein